MMLVEGWMKKSFAKIDEGSKIGEVKKILREHGSSCGIVCSDEKFLGMVKADELLGMEDDLSIKEYIHDLFYTLDPQDTLDEAAVFFLESDLEILPVVSDGKVVGALSLFDILDAFTQMAGFGEGGIRLEVELNDTPGSLKHVLDILYLHSMNVLSMLLYPAEQIGQRVVVIRVEGKNVKELSRILDVNDVTYRSIIKEEKI